MGHGAGGRDSVHHSGQNVGGGGAACYDGCLRPVGGCPWSVRPSGAELAHGPVCSPAYPGCLGGDSHLVVHYAEHRGLQHLCLYERGLHNDDRLVGEGYLALLHSIDVAGELHSGEIMPELGIAVPGKELLEKAFRHGAEIGHHFQHLLGAAHYSPVVVFRGFSVEQVENSRFFAVAAFPEGLSHSVLVLVRAICKFLEFHSQTDVCQYERQTY